MPINLDRYRKLKADVDRCQREADRAEGALSQLMAKLEEEFGCKSLKEAEKLLVKLRKESKKAEKEFGEALNEFEEKWEEVLSDG